MKGMSAIVRTMTCLLLAPILLFGAYVVLHGHLTPGGGFQGGAIIATGMALFLVALGGERWRKKLLSMLESTGLNKSIFSGENAPLSFEEFFARLDKADPASLNEMVESLTKTVLSEVAEKTGGLAVEKTKLGYSERETPSSSNQNSSLANKDEVEKIDVLDK